MARKKRTSPTVRWSVHIPMVVAAVVENHFFDQLHKKPSYGKRQELVVQLLQKWIKEQQEAGTLRLFLSPEEAEAIARGEELTQQEPTNAL